MHDSDHNLKKKISRSASGSLVIKILSTALSFLTSVFLARILGISEYGTYIYALSLKALLGFIAIFGFDRFLIKEISVLNSKQAWGEISGILRFSNKTTSIISVVLFVLATLSVWGLVGYKDPQRLYILSIAFASLIPGALGGLRAATLSGLNFVLLGQLPDLLLQPIIFISLTSLVYFYIGSSINLLWVMGAWLLSTWINFLLGIFILLKKIPEPAKHAEPNYEKSKEWIANALPFIFISAMNVVLNKTDIIMLEPIAGSAAVGIYAVCTRSSQFVAFILMAMNSSLAPTIARLYANGQKENLQKIITKTTRVVSLTAIPIVLVLVIFGKQILSLYGPEFISGYTTLLILSISQLVNVATGSVGLLLNMTGNQQEVAIGIGISAALNVLLNIFLIPHYGIAGAAFATASSMVIQNFHLMFVVHKRLGIRSSALG